MYYLRKTYREHRIRKKKIKKTKLLTPKQIIKIEKETKEVYKKLVDLKSQGYRILFIDEMCTTKSTIPTHEWSPVNQPVKIDYK